MSAPTDVPALVARALDLSRQRGFITSTRRETGALLAALAASRSGLLAELGTGCGVGSAWLVSGARPGTQVVSVELDPLLAGDVQRVFAGVDHVEVVAGDWRQLTERGPFSLIFTDVPDVMAEVDALADLVEPGGLVVLDDFVASSAWPPIVDGQVDTVRERWLSDDRFASAELLIDPDTAVVIATRR